MGNSISNNRMVHWVFSRKRPLEVSPQSLTSKPLLISTVNGQPISSTYAIGSHIPQPQDFGNTQPHENIQQYLQKDVAWGSQRITEHLQSAPWANTSYTLGGQALVDGLSNEALQQGISWEHLHDVRWASN